MSRSLRQRIEWLEGDWGNKGTPDMMIMATCPIPEADLPLSAETIERWLAEGLAHIVFRGHTVFYDGGESHPLTLEEWQTETAPGDTDKSVR